MNFKKIAKLRCINITFRLLNHLEGEKTTAPVELLLDDQWERLHNPNGELGLAAEHQRAVANPRGDCNSKKEHPTQEISQNILKRSRILTHLD